MEADAETKGLREEISLLGPRTPARRYPDELRIRIAKWALARQQLGLGAQQLEDLVGVPWESLSRWMKGAGASKEGAAVLRPVRVNSAPPSRPLTLRTASGHTVEGLDVVTLADLLSRL